MRWPWRKRPPMDDARARIDKLQQRADQQEFLSSQAVAASRDLTERTGETRSRAEEVRERNHLGEAVEAAFAPRQRKTRFPWPKHST